MCCIVNYNITCMNVFYLTVDKDLDCVSKKSEDSDGITLSINIMWWKWNFVHFLEYQIMKLLILTTIEWW